MLVSQPFFGAELARVWLEFLNWNGCASHCNEHWSFCQSVWCIQDSLASFLDCRLAAAARRAVCNDSECIETRASHLTLSPLISCHFGMFYRRIMTHQDMIWVLENTQHGNWLCFVEITETTGRNGDIADIALSSCELDMMHPLHIHSVGLPIEDGCSLVSKVSCLCWQPSNSPESWFAGAWCTLECPTPPLDFSLAALWHTALNWRSKGAVASLPIPRH